ncbi:MAG: serine O-acetyltransferase [Candidatus Competibacteraceae bacterium]
MDIMHFNDTKDSIWQIIQREAEAHVKQEPILASFFYASVLNHVDFESALSFQLAGKLHHPAVSPMLLRKIIDEALAGDPRIGQDARADIKATYDRDPACNYYFIPLLFFKGFHALQGARVAHWLWTQQRQSLALLLESTISQVMGVDIHPAASIGSGLLVDHATGLVVGETAVIEDNVSIMQGVTLGGTGKESGDRHPKVRTGVLIGAGATVLGNIEIGHGAKIGAGSVVLSNVPPNCTVAGIPARIVARLDSTLQPALEMNHQLLSEAPPAKTKFPPLPAVITQLYKNRSLLTENS